MKKFFIVFLFSVIALIPIQFVNAETCDNKQMNEFNKLASGVTIDYEVFETNGEEAIAINVYNLSEDMYVNVVASGYPESVLETRTMYIHYNQTDNGKYSIMVNDLDHIATYTFRIISNNCDGAIRNVKIIKPKKNKFHDMDVCKYQEVLDYYYCKEWLTEEIEYEDSEVIKKIGRERVRNTTTTTTRCFTCEERELEAAAAKKFNQIKTYVIIGLSAGIAMDILIIIVLIVRIRRYSI